MTSPLLSVSLLSFLRELVSIKVNGGRTKSETEAKRDEIDGDGEQSKKEELIGI
jgi:hypothetical protein